VSVTLATSSETPHCSQLLLKVLQQSALAADTAAVCSWPFAKQALYLFCRAQTWTAGRQKAQRVSHTCEPYNCEVLRARQWRLTAVQFPTPPTTSSHHHHSTRQPTSIAAVIAAPLLSHSPCAATNCHRQQLAGPYGTSQTNPCLCAGYHRPYLLEYKLSLLEYKHPLVNYHDSHPSTPLP
jgi:hypothetical protein